MQTMNQPTIPAPGAPLRKFSDPDWTARGEHRARVVLKALRTLSRVARALEGWMRRTEDDGAVEARA